ncbi:MAG: tetratricopeptide repeat protein [Chlorobi bacterium CHB2]|nr:tetratricopeptide repeat protein [Chlorobi bacterium CHB2]
MNQRRPIKPRLGGKARGGIVLSGDAVFSGINGNANMRTPKRYFARCGWATALCLLLLAACAPVRKIPPREPARGALPPERGRIEYHFLRGSVFQMQGEFQRAIGEFQRVLRVDTANGPANAAIARCWQRLRRADSALPYAAAAVRATPEHLPSRQQYAELLATAGLFDSAVAQCRFIILRKPYDPNAHYMIAVIMEGRDPAEAISHFEFLRRTTEDDYDLLLNLAELYINTSQFANAASTLRDAVELSPNDPDVYALLVDAYGRDSAWSKIPEVIELAANRIGDSASVEEFFLDHLTEFLDDAQLPISPQQRQYGAQLATIAANRSVSWRMSLYAGITLHAADPAALRADTLAKQGLSNRECTQQEWELVAEEWSQQAEPLRALQVLLPSGWRLRSVPAIPLTLGKLYGKLHQPDSAEWYTRLAIAAFPGDAEGWAQLGELLEQQGRHTEACAAWDQVLRREPDDLVTLCRYAVSLADRSARLDDALRMAQLALRLNDSFPICHDAVGWTLLKMGEPHQALPYLERAAENGPPSPEIFRHLAEAYESLGNPDKARAAWEKAGGRETMGKR